MGDAGIPGHHLIGYVFETLRHGGEILHQIGGLARRVPVRAARAERSPFLMRLALIASELSGTTIRRASRKEASDARTRTGKMTMARVRKSVPVNLSLSVARDGRYSQIRLNTMNVPKNTTRPDTTVADAISRRISRLIR